MKQLLSTYLIIAISVIVSVGLVFLLKDNLGIQGEQGIQGLQGIQGEKGEQGIPGVSGKDGITTYKIQPPFEGKWVEYCVEKGFVVQTSYWCASKIYFWEK